MHEDLTKRHMCPFSTDSTQLSVTQLKFGSRHVVFPSRKYLFKVEGGGGHSTHATQTRHLRQGKTQERLHRCHAQRRVLADPATFNNQSLLLTER